jgi:hypothetical protein
LGKTESGCVSEIAVEDQDGERRVGLKRGKDGKKIALGDWSTEGNLTEIVVMTDGSASNGDNPSCAGRETGKEDGVVGK